MSMEFELPRLLSPSTTGLPLALAGVGSHLVYWIHGQKSNREVRSYLLVQVLANTALLAFGIRQTSLGVLGSSLALTILNTYYYAGLFTSIITYRLFFHRLRRFPGPLSLKISKFFALQANIAKNQYVLRIWDLHKKYGDIVRTGPQELSILDVDGVSLIYGPGSTCSRGPWYERFHAIGADDEEKGLFFITDPAVHAARKKAVWSKAFNIGSLKDYEHLVLETAQHFVQALGQRAGTPISGVKAMRLLLFDMMGAVSWGSNFENIERWELNPILGAVEKLTEPEMILGQVPWLFNLLINIPGADAPIRPLNAWMRNQFDKKLSEEMVGSDAMSKIVHSKERLSIVTLRQEGELMVVAGGDTTATAMASLIFHLARNQRIQSKLRSELDSVSSLRDPRTFDYRPLSSLPYLDAVITEILRLHPPSQGIHQRTTPPEGLRLPNGAFIPGDTNLGIPKLPLHRDPRYYVDPETFLPERWTDEEPDKVLNKQAYFPFGGGAYQCPGKALSFIKMKTATALILSRFEIRLATGEDGKRFLEETKDCQGAHLGDFLVVFSERS